MLKKHYDRLSKIYELSDYFFEKYRYSKIRPIVWSYASGKTLDLGMGTGLNIPYYPLNQIKEIEGVDLSEGMLDLAILRAAKYNIPIKFHQMDAAQLKFPDQSFDTVVSTFLFCVLPNEIQPLVLSQIHRILRPGGRLILLEYTYSQNPLRRFFMRIMAPYVRWVYRAGFDRRTDQFLTQDKTWKIETDLFLYKDIVRLIVARTQ